MLVEFSIDGEEQDTVVSKTNALCTEYRQFIKDARHFIKILIAHQVLSFRLVWEYGLENFN